jgi:hypothetical protein
MTDAITPNDLSPEQAAEVGKKNALAALEKSPSPIFAMDEFCDKETDRAYAIGWNSIWASEENGARWKSQESMKK